MLAAFIMKSVLSKSCHRTALKVGILPLEAASKDHPVYPNHLRKIV